MTVGIQRRDSLMQARTYGEVFVVFDGGEAVWTDDFIDFGLDFALDVWVDETGEDEAVKNRGGGV